ncbi:MAG TPA: type VI secretion system Vgr family protein [Trinickia sp.]
MNTNLSIQDLRRIATGMQNKRLLTLSFPQGDAPYAILLANRLEGEEFLSRDFRFVVEILSDNAKLDPKDFVDKQITVQLLRDDGSYRYFNGYIFSYRFVKTDGDIAFYEAEIGPWLRYLTLRKNNRLFLDLAIRGQTATIFDDYGALPVWDWKVREADPPMTMACQFDEHDHNYVHRRWEHRGLCYWYEHTATEHKLIVSDPVRTEPAIDGASPEIAYRRDIGSQEADGIASWSPIQQTTSTHIAESRADFKAPTLNARTGGLADSRTDEWKNSGKQKLEWYEYAGAYGHRDTEDGQQLTGRRVEAIEAIARQYEATGNNRFVMPGRWFQLTDHFGRSVSDNHYDDQYLITYAHHLATNNYLQGVGAQATYVNRFTCVKKRTPWRPMRGYNSVDTRILAPQTATVVGPEGESVYTDEYGRCLVQFHWDREGKYTTWVRVSSGWAGGSQGMTALPRIGSEVIVMWLDGNPDHPIVTGRLGNAANLSAWQLPEQRALAGIRSRELVGGAGNQAGGNSNHLVFDDTAGAIQTQLRSDHGGSQLSLGSITRIEGWRGRQDARGEGFELRTDMVGAIRAAQGLLISTDSRAGAKGRVLDRQELVGQLEAALAIAKQLADLSSSHEADSTDTVPQEKLLDKLKQWDTEKPSGAALIGVSAPDGVAIASPLNVVASAGRHVDVIAVQDVNVSTGRKILMRAAQGLSAFAKAGMKLIAGTGDIAVQAQQGKTEVGASERLHLYSLKDVLIEAPNIVLKANGVTYSLGDGKVLASSSGEHKIETSRFSFTGGGGGNPELPQMPSSTMKTNEQFALADRAGQALKNVEHKVFDETGAVRDAGRLGADGAHQTIVQDTQIRPLTIRPTP